MKCAALKAHGFSKERAQKGGTTPRGISGSVLTVRNTREVKAFPGFSCICELSTKGKDK